MPGKRLFYVILKIKNGCILAFIAVSQQITFV